MIRKKNRVVSLLLTVLTFFSLMIVSVTSYSAAENTVQTTDAVRLRSSAKIESDNTITTLNVSEELTLLENSKDGWALVSRKNGTKGYCSVDYLKVPDNSKVVFKGTTNDDVFLRKGPSTDNEIIRLLNKGTSFTVSDNSNELWVKVKAGSDYGYVYREYTDLALELYKSTAPVMPDDDTNTPDWYDSSALDDLLGESSTRPQIENSSVRVYLSEENITVEERAAYNLTVYTSVPDAVSSVTFKTSDKNVATVTDTGLVKGVSKGTAVITAYINGTEETAACSVTVIPSTLPPEEDVLEISKTELEINAGNHYQLTANQPVKWKTSDSSVVSVSNGIITAKSTGSAVITAYTEKQSITCTVMVIKATNGVTINDTSATVSAGKTYYNGASSESAVTWTSSDTSVAKVQNGFITAVSKGKAVITAHNSKGTKTCLVTVEDAEPIRFAYSQPNTAAKNEKVTLYAVTDTLRKEVKFEVNVNGKVTTVNAASKTKDGSTYLWSGEIKISSSGKFNVVAYSRIDGAWQTCGSSDDAKTTVFIRETQDLSKETLETRRPTDDGIALIAAFEGYSSSVYFDKIANNIPTIGYGKVIYLGDSFYNDMTKKEAYAYLVRTVNEGGFTSSVNSYLNKFDIYRNQQQFDSLVSFCYNLGSNILLNDSDFKKLFTAPVLQEGESGKDAFCNGSDVNLRSGAATSYEVLTVLKNGDLLTLIETEPVNNWYHVKTKDGIEGYVYADYVTKGVIAATDKHYLSKINKDDFTELLLQYHHAGPSCVWGLLYRRVDELDVFYYGEYKKNGANNVNNFDFKCSVNSSTTL